MKTQTKITPCLWFDGDAEEAAGFYVSLLRGSRIDHIMRSPTDTPSGPAGSVLTVEFSLSGQPFLALNGGRPNGFNEAVSFIINCENQAEVDRLWSDLTANGGQEIACGWLRDRWGLSWQITPTRLLDLIKDDDREKAGRAMRAMMNMVKIDIEQVELAASGDPTSEGGAA